MRRAGLQRDRLRHRREPGIGEKHGERSRGGSIGNAFYGALTHKNGAAEQSNFHNYRLIRHHEAPKQIQVHFVENDIDPTGLGEPPFPPVFGAVANALYKNRGKRFYNQPFGPELEKRISG